MCKENMFIKKKMKNEGEKYFVYKHWTFPLFLYETANMQRTREKLLLLKLLKTKNDYL